MALDSRSWFTEQCPEAGTAFSFKITARLHEERSPYQRIEIYDTEHFGRLMVIDGFVMLTGRDNFIYHEMMSHPALFTHPQPKTVAIIGGGDCGTLRETLRHADLEQVVQIEIDERVTRLSEQYFPELCAGNNDPRAQLLFCDGIEWLARREPESLDVIIVDSTDPIGPAEGLFRAPFYRDAWRTLKSPGILIQQSESPLIHLPLLQRMHSEMKAAGFQERRSLHFPQCCYPSGWWSATMAGKHIQLDTFRREAATGKTFPTQFYSAAVHENALALPPFVAEALSAVNHAQG